MTCIKAAGNFNKLVIVVMPHLVAWRHRVCQLFALIALILVNNRSYIILLLLCIKYNLVLVAAVDNFWYKMGLPNPVS